ncbi:hypothetical protein SAMD00019534_072660 [Acytostelium subglobosum LB1]|uniref:hypothetical protein n=1 Tax=Acytostelium subglobosum LB1 TaxID=1410327 RepID=UPI0006451165|nr:hypothetical protein SAMD00019534_072660 [Acytostelium subglobosum LB1]GAM24091.1 hypothetical protein SAMD00019534_072660 [Acytostelium subglobosum LB1]|eukprot:XP_012753127.1 hypothetical protein SAMD00019534_072660 [Acytostelium subglobosum LB1]
MQDPYYYGQSKIQSSIVGLTSLHERWRKLLHDTNTFRNEEFRWCQQELKKVLKDIDDDIKDLYDSIIVVEKFPDRFRLSQAEIETRKRFIRDSKATVDGVVNDMTSPEVAGKIEQDKRAELLFSEKKQNMQRESKYSGIQRAVEEDNNEFLRGNVRIQEDMIREQDAGLEQLGERVGILGEMGKTMSSELKSQGSILDRLGDRAANSQNALGSVMRRLDRLMENTSSKVQWIMIGILAVIFVVLVIITSQLFKKK